MWQRPAASTGSCPHVQPAETMLEMQWLFYATEFELVGYAAMVTRGKCSSKNAHESQKPQGVRDHTSVLVNACDIWFLTLLHNTQSSAARLSSPNWS